MKKESCVISCLLILGFFGGITSQYASAQIIVPDDYTTIQAAVNAASPYTEIFVRAGIYPENVNIPKPLTIKGEDKNTTIINGGGTGRVLYISANYVTIQGLTVTNGEWGIYLIPNYSIKHVVIKDCIVTINKYGFDASHVYGNIKIEDCEISKSQSFGFYSHQFSNSIIKNCKVFDNQGSFGILIAWCNNTYIVGCDVYSNHVGIYLDSTYYCYIENNHIYGNQKGVNIYRWGNGVGNIVRDNIIENNSVGVTTISGNLAYNNFIYHNDFISNVEQARDYNYRNTWDDGYPSGGNYWDDYSGTDVDHDGIGDTPYNFQDGRDDYPLIWPLWSPLNVDIDIKPGSDPNSINLGSNGNVPVAIFSTTTFDATTVLPETLTLAGATVKVKGKGTPMASEQDINGDGILDLIVHIDTTALQLSLGDTEAILEGETGNGIIIRGVDMIRIVQE